MRLYNLIAEFLDEQGFEVVIDDSHFVHCDKMNCTGCRGCLVIEIWTLEAKDFIKYDSRYSKVTHSWRALPPEDRDVRITDPKFFDKILKSVCILNSTRLRIR